MNLTLCVHLSIQGMNAHLKLGEMENFEVVYFLGAELFLNFRGGLYLFVEPVSPRWNLALFGPKL